MGILLTLYVGIMSKLCDRLHNNKSITIGKLFLAIKMKVFWIIVWIGFEFMDYVECVTSSVV